MGGSDTCVIDLANRLKPKICTKLAALAKFKSV